MSPSPPEAASTEDCWAVYRQDDNGNRFVVARGLPHEAAQRLARVFEERGHKQVYWVEADPGCRGGA